MKKAPLSDSEHQQSSARCHQRASVKNPVAVSVVLTHLTVQPCLYLLEAAGTTAAIIATYAISDSMVPLTRNLNSPDDEPIGLDLVFGSSRHRGTNCVLANGLGFGRQHKLGAWKVCRVAVSAVISSRHLNRVPSGRQL